MILQSHFHLEKLSQRVSKQCLQRSIREKQKSEFYSPVKSLFILSGVLIVATAGKHHNVIGFYKKPFFFFVHVIVHCGQHWFTKQKGGKHGHSTVPLLFRDPGSVALSSITWAFQGHQTHQHKPMDGEREEKAYLLLTHNTSAHIPLMNTYHRAPPKWAQG